MDVTTATAKPLGRRPRLPRTLAMLTLVAASLAYDDAAAQAPVALPDYPGQVMLIKNTLTAVNHGNLTGNYTIPCCAIWPPSASASGTRLVTWPRRLPDCAGRNST